MMGLFLFSFSFVLCQLAIMLIAVESSVLFKIDRSKLQGLTFPFVFVSVLLSGHMHSVIFLSILHARELQKPSLTPLRVESSYRYSLTDLKDPKLCSGPPKRAIVFVLS